MVPAWHHPESRAYLEQRGLSQGEVAEYWLGYCDRGPFRRRVVIPMFDETGALVAYQGRLIVPGEPRYRTEGPRPIYGPFNLTEYDSTTLCIVEGPFDLYAVARVTSACATLGVYPSEDQIITLQGESKNYQKYLIWFDQTAKKEAFALQQRLNAWIPTEVCFDIDHKDPGECPPDFIQGIVFPL